MQLFEKIDALSRSILIALVGLLPFFFIPVPWITASQSKIGLAALLLLVVALLWFCARIIEGGIRLPWSMVLATTALLPLAYAVSAVVSGATPLSLVGSGLEPDTLAFVCLEFGALVLAASLFCSRQGAVVGALRAFLFGSLVAGALKIVYLAVPTLTFGGALVGQTGNAVGSWYSFALVMGVMFFTCVALLRPGSMRTYWSYVYALCAILAAGLLVMVNFFTVWLIVLCSFCALMAVFAYRERSFSFGALWAAQWPAIIGAFVALFFLVFGSFIVNVLPEGIRSPQVEVRPSWQGTLAVGERSLNSPLSLLFGSGPNTFTRVWGLHKPIEVNQTPFWNTSFNSGVAVIPTSFVTVGIVGVLAWIVSMVALLVTIIRLWGSRSAGVPKGTMALSIVCLGLAASHFLLVPAAALTLLMFLLIGILLGSLGNVLFAARHVALRGSGWEGAGHLAGTIVFTIIVVVSTGAIIRVMLANTFLNRAAVVYNTDKDIQAASDLISKALAIYPSDRSHRAAVELGLLELKELSANTESGAEEARKALQATLERTIAHGLSAVELDGSDYQNWLELASLYSQLAGSNVEGAYENARAAYERALENNPTSPLPLLNLAQLEIVRKQPDAALEYLARALELKPDLAAAYYLASQIYAGKKDFTNALTAAARAAQLAPNDSQAWYNAGVIAYAGDQLNDAILALEKALSLQPQFANALYVLGLSYSKIGRTEDALRVFTSLDSLDPGQKAVQEMLEKLKASQPAVGSGEE